MTVAIRGRKRASQTLGTCYGLRVNFAISSDTLALQSAVREFVKEHVPRALIEPDDARGGATALGGGASDDVVRKLGASKLLGQLVPGRLGGQGRGESELALVLEELSAGNPSVALSLLSGEALVLDPLARFGTAKQTRLWLGPLMAGDVVGSSQWADVDDGVQDTAGGASAGLTASRGPGGAGWVLNGETPPLLDAERASFALILARPPKVESAGDEAGSAWAFLVPLKAAGATEGLAAGVTVRPKVRGFAARDAPRAVLSFKNCVVSDDARFAAGSSLPSLGARSRLVHVGVAAVMVGLARAAYETVLFTVCNAQSGAAGQSTHFKLSEMFTDLEAARALIWNATAAGPGADAQIFAAQKARLFGCEAAVRVTSNAVQVLGALGSEESRALIEQLVCDAAFVQNCWGSVGVQRTAVGRRVVQDNVA